MLTFWLRNFWKAACFSPQTTKSAVCHIFWILIGESEIRFRGGFGASWITIYHSTWAPSAGWCGNNDAICPSGQRPKRAMSGISIVSEYSSASTSREQRQRNCSDLNPRGFKNTSQTYLSFRSGFSGATQRSSTRHQRRRLVSIHPHISLPARTDIYQPSSEWPPGRPIVTIFFFFQ